MDQNPMKVHVWHVSVTIGDAAIHLLVDESTSIGRKAGTIRKAVLVDGGKSSSADELVNAIEHIQTVYLFDDEFERNLRFDAIVITHWDTDHYRGVMGLMAHGIQAELDECAAFQTLCAESDNNYQRVVVAYGSTPHTALPPPDTAKAEFTTIMDNIMKAGGSAKTKMQTQLQVIYNALSANNQAPDDAKLDLDKVDSVTLPIAVKCRYCKYGAGYPDTTFNTPLDENEYRNKLLTSLYVPYAAVNDDPPTVNNRLGPVVGEVADTEGEKTARAERGRDERFFSANLNKVYRHRALDTAPNTLTYHTTSGYSLNKSYPIPTPSGQLWSTKKQYMSPTSYTKDWDCAFVCNVYAHYEDYLSRELFYGRRGGEWTQVTNPARLVINQGLVRTNGPRMFIVAGDQMIIGESPLDGPNAPVIPFHSHKAARPLDVASNKSHPSAPHVINRPVPGKLGQRIVRRTRHGIDKNSASLVMVTLVATLDAQPAPGEAASSYKILHYSAGDVSWDVEGGVAKWLANGYTDGKPVWDSRTVAMKISHHGSKWETSINLLSVLSPQFYVISNPKNGNYAHPNAETLIMLDAQMQARSRLEAAASPAGRVGGRAKPLLCTWYPRWLLNTRNININLTALSHLDPHTRTDENAHIFNFQSAVEAAYGGSEAVGVLTLWQKEITNNRRHNTKAKLGQFLASNLWDNISEMQAPQVGSASQLKAWKLVLGFSDTSLRHQAWWGGDDYRYGPAPPDVEIGASSDEEGPDSDPSSPMQDGPTAQSSSAAFALPSQGTPDTIRPGAQNLSMEDEDELPTAMEEDPLEKAMMYEDEAGDFKGLGWEIDYQVQPAGPRTRSRIRYDPVEDFIAERDKPDIPEDVSQSMGSQGHLMSNPRAFLAVQASERMSQSRVGGTRNNVILNTRPSQGSSAPLTDGTRRDSTTTERAPTSSFQASAEKLPLNALSSNIAIGQVVDIRSRDVSREVTSTAGAMSSAIFLLGSNYGNGPFQTNEVRLQTGPLDNFLNMLPSASLLLDGSIGPSTKLDARDKWLRAMKVSGYGPQDVGLGCLVDAQSGFVQVAEITTSIPVGSPPVQLQFSTANTFAVMHPASSSNPGGIAPAFLHQYNILALGLAPTLIGLDLTQVLTLFGPSWVQNLGGILELPGIGGGFKLKLSGRPMSRNAIYFRPDLCWTSYLRLQFDIEDSETVSKIQSTLDFLGNIDVTNTSLICLKRARCQKVTAFKRSSTIESTLTLTTTVTIHPGDDDNKDKPLSTQLWLVFQPQTTKLVIQFKEKGIVDDVFKWLTGKVTGVSISGSLGSFLPTSEFEVEVHQVEIDLQTPSAGQKFGISNVTLILELKIFGSVFLTKLRYPSFSLHADLWTCLPPQTSDYNLNHLPWWQEFDDVYPYNASPNNASPMTGRVSLKSLLRGSSSSDLIAPQGISLDISQASFDAQKPANGPLSLKFAARMDCNKPTSSELPVLNLESLDLSAEFLAKTAFAPSEWNLSMSTTVLLSPREGINTPGRFVSILSVSVTIDTGIWTISASAQQVQFAALYDLFDHNANDTVMDMLEEISIPFFSITYTHGPETSSFVLNGALQVHTLILDITYTYEAKKDWSFKAQLGAINNSGDSTLTLIHLIREFDKDAEIADALSAVPFVRDIAIPSVQANPAGFDDAPVQFSMSSSATGAIIMWFRLEIDTNEGALSLLFVQYKPTPPATSASSEAPTSGTAPHTTSPRPKPKRLLRVSLDHLPSLPKIPIVGQIGPPVDSIQYVLVQDPQAKLDKIPTAGFTRDEIQQINGTLPTSGQILYKDVKSALQSDKASMPTHSTATSTTPATSPGTTTGSETTTTTLEYLLLEGHHFVVVTQGKVVLDHVFGATTPTPAPATKDGHNGKAVAVRSKIAQDASTPSATKEDSGATMGPNKKSFGPLTIKNVGIQCKDNFLYIILDAVVMLGPIELDLEGFGIGLPLAKLKFNELTKLTCDDFSPQLRGLGVLFNQPPVSIAGFFEKETTETFEAFRGGLMVSILPYALLAVGEYQHTLKPVDFKSVFVYARLEGPLFTLEFAEISGVAASFGHNFDLRLPRVEEILDFPLVHAQEAVQNPMDLIAKDSPGSFLQWTTAVQDSNFFSIGMTVNAFQVLTLDAALVVNLSADDVRLSLIGIASASMPPEKGKPPDAFLYVELGVVATLDITGGSLIVTAQLTANSYILDPDCHLTGGFALCYWFGNSPHAGDWVFTVGGYHPAFSPPTYWPVPPRVGISWNLSDALTVKGEAFFAVTPSAIMGGGRLLAVFNAGPIYASFEAWASFLIKFKRFFFIADIGIRISVGFHVNLGLIHFDIHVTRGASVHLQGPPFGGSASIDIGVVGFTVYFGDQDDEKPALSWPEFLEVARKPGVGSAETAAVDLVVIALEAGSAEDKPKGANQKPDNVQRATGQKWSVRAGALRFRIESKMPMNSADIGDGTKSVSHTLSQDPFYAKLTHEPKALQSTMKVRITPPIPPTSVAADLENPWNVTPIIRGLPNALWTQYSTDGDPSKSGNNIASILNDSGPASTTTNHLVGWSFAPPKSRWPTKNIPAFNAVAAMKEGVFQDGVPNPRGDKNPLLKIPPDVGDQDLRPVLKPSAPVQSVDLPAPRGEDPYGHVQTAWSAVDDNTTKDIAVTWAKLFAWEGSAPGFTKQSTGLPPPPSPPPRPPDPGSGASVPTTPPPVPLNTTKPAYLLDQKNFLTEYLGAPWLAAKKPLPGM